MREPIITTNPALCHDCYRCVRNCSVKAIRVRDGQAAIVPELCIVCGTCVRICPQNAKGVHRARPLVERAIAARKRVVASVAPSAPASFDIASFPQMEAALLRLGFHAAEETAVGARIVAIAHREYGEAAPQLRPLISSACPVVVNLVEQYCPDLIPRLAPIVSPMIAHGRMLRQRYGEEAFVVFIGPCIAKKQELLEPPVAGAVDAAMTFRGLAEWLAEAGIAFPPPAAGGDGGDRSTRGAHPPEGARLFALEGGLLGAARLSTDLLGDGVVVATGIDACRETLADIQRGTLDAGLVELMACKGGCVNGPHGAGHEGGLPLARQRVLRFRPPARPARELPRDEWPPLVRTLENRQVPLPEFGEEQIREVLAKVDKHGPDDLLNCGACGYASCREKAVATLRGMAEMTMCIPYMRRRSESLRQVVMDVAPDAIVIVDFALRIQDVSPSAERLFGCELATVAGRPLSDLLPATADFVAVRDGGEPLIGKIRSVGAEITVEQTIVRVENHGLLVAILRDISERARERERWNALREETLARTREVVGKQMRVAHRIAQLLGETTAESKTIVTRLARLLEEEGPP